MSKAMEAAFPRPFSEKTTIGTEYEPAQKGLTKREYFAALIMAAQSVSAVSGSHNMNNYENNQDRAKFALDNADALIEALENSDLYAWKEV